jgi:hypothetical protein
MQNETANMLPSQLFFGLAILAFMALLVMEKLKPYRRFANNIHKDLLLLPTPQHFCSIMSS